MDIGQAIFWKLTADPEIDPALAALLGKRVYPDTSPDNIYPFVAHTVSNETPQPLNGTPILQKLVATLTIAAATRTQAILLGGLVADALDRQTGIWGGITVRGCTNNSDTQDSVSEVSNAERIFYLTEQTYKIHAFQR